MLDIEYRRKYKLDRPYAQSRRDVYDFSEYLNSLVREVKLAGISIHLRETEISEDSEEKNDVIINGRTVAEILDGLKLIIPATKDCSTCGGVCGTGSCGTGEREDLDWNHAIIEDIPDIILKNAISKALADSHKE
ncbi:MAG: hypothetical protein PWQ88_136 [Candidatus Methanomethylophilaceae archaeon]|nr:hypothetical protein [Candidatus Methanomethylophilaceae archaeon]MDI3541725.1 hypothetical protein [Candidatus Methanomethylophilaceae archaeon]HIJ00949.1 DUF2703 domain-containing protein [Candidatus Methanomethylophilaceae archaeon]